LVKVVYKSAMRCPKERRASARGLSIAALILAIGGCAHGQRISTERRPDGIVHLKCQTTLADCLYEVENVCDHRRYVVLRAVDARDLKGAEPAKMLVHSSEAFVRCGETGAWGTANKNLLEAPLCAEPATAPNAAPVPARACTPGATQTCVGPAGCAGGQACAPDGSRFGPCDCGPQATPPAAAPSP
jgi:hypothetical protein